MSLLQMSLSGALLVSVIVLIRALAVNRLPKKTFLALWGVALVRLLIPYSLPSALSVYSLAGRLAPAAEAPSGLPLPQIIPITPAAGAAVMPSTPAVPGAVALDPWAVVWLSGVIACAIFFAAAWWRCRREFREALPVGNDYARRWLAEHHLYRTIELRQSDRISAPLTYGVFRPVILMPKTVDWDDQGSLRYVLAHEYVHILRFDAVTKLMLTAALCVHWFNPAVWVMYVLANRDLELSCDEAVVRSFGEGTESAYAMTLIRMEETRSGLTPLCNNFSKNAIEERIVAIMKMKKTSWAAALLALALVVGVTAAFATSAPGAAAKATGSPSNPTGDGEAVIRLVDESQAAEAADPPYASAEGGAQGDAQRSETGFAWPVPGAEAVSAGYETRVGVDTGVFHSGVDIPAPKGTVVAAACSGTVTAAGWDNGGGNCVEIAHGDGCSTVYRHLSEIQVEIGQEVACGQQIGTVGSTGLSTGAHLHFEIRFNGEAKDPMPFF